MAGTDILMVRRPIDRVADGVYTIGGQGNSLLVDHGDALLLVDAGPGGDVTRTMIALVRETTQKPVSHIVYSHGHMGYNFGVKDWLTDAQERNHPRPQIVSQERLPVRYRRYRETSGLQSYTNTRQFRTAFPADFPPHWFMLPDVTYGEELSIKGSAREIRLLSAPSETDDATAVWLPTERILYGSCAFIKSCPNAGSPYRIFRDPMQWVRTLERFLELQPGLLIPEFGKPLTRVDDIEAALNVPIRAIRFLRKEVVARMNRGMSDVEIIHDIDYPREIFDHPFLKPGYGCPEYLVREIWRSENGWWDRNPTNLHPSHPKAAASAVLAAIGNARQVLHKATELRGKGETQLALHVVDLIALAGEDLAVVNEAKSLKAQLLQDRSRQVDSAVSRQIYLSEAEVLLDKEIGSFDREKGIPGFEWV